MGKGPEEPRELSKRQYEKELELLQTELVRMQEWIVEAGLRVVVLFEGRDTAARAELSSASRRGRAPE